MPIAIFMGVVQWSNADRLFGEVTGNSGGG
jgi:hypothetical protein